MKYLLYGQDIDQTTTPLEAGLGWITKLDKGDFIGRPALLEQKQKGPSRRLAAFEMMPKAIPRPGYDLLVAGQIVGRVASGVFSPSLKKGIGTGYLPLQHAVVGTRLDVIIRGQSVEAQVVQPPFYQQGTHR
jgi:aminomethyltransferase